MRLIPATMATQHPDNAQAPYWDKADPKRPLIRTYQEIGESVACFQDFGVEEYMWDWEGKHADAMVIDRLYSDHHEYFSENQLGRDKFLTFRIPNIWEEKGYNLLQAMTAMLSSEDFARDLKFPRPLFETILPMTERADQLTHMQELFERLAEFKNSQFTPDREPNNTYLEMIPLVESVESQQGVAALLEEYVKLHEQHFNFRPEYIRTFLACSDSALSSGLLAGLIGNKIALSELFHFSERSGIAIYPIAGAGSLRFRGGLSPDTVERFIQEYPGVRTVSIQSAFRYDNPMDKVKLAIAELQKKLPESKPRVFDEATSKGLKEIGNISAGYYKQTLNGLIPDMQPIFKSVPKRRDRRQHIGLLSYARSMGEQSLPRAITFTGGFYSVGVPPELIGIGRALREMNPDQLNLLRQEYPNVVHDMDEVGHFLSRDNLSQLASSNPAWKDVADDISGVEDVLGIKLQPETDAHCQHGELAKQLLATDDKDQRAELITQMAVLRKSVG